MITISDVAKDKIKEAMNKNPDRYFRIMIQGFG
jgi:Fe-S cluster assembly iron-binding protein IscA